MSFNGIERKLRRKLLTWGFVVMRLDTSWITSANRLRSRPVPLFVKNPTV
jgi:hypothetical protein